MKRCTNCNAVKSDDEFSKQKRKSGTYTLSSWCKKCLSDYKKQHYSKNKNKYLEKSKKQREDNPEEVRAYQKEYYRKKKTSIQAKIREYSQTEEGREANTP